jgi:hypothetical protein
MIMEAIITKINRVSIALLVAIGLQYFMVGALTMRFMDFSGFSTINWILEVIYISFTISLALRTDI